MASGDNLDGASNILVKCNFTKQGLELGALRAVAEVDAKARQLALERADRGLGDAHGAHERRTSGAGSTLTALGAGWAPSLLAASFL
eukprot:4683240-Prymnesium_polylepis.1